MNNMTCKMSLALAAATILMVASAVAYPNKPSFLGCTSSDDCGVDECCVLGMMRYSVPVCKPLGDEGETCRPRGGDLDVPQNTTVYYPDGTSADLNVHMVMCPCAAGLECTGMTCTGLDGAGKLVLREDYTDVDELNQLRRRR